MRARYAFAGAIAGDRRFFIGGALRCGGGKVRDVLQLILR
jgi:hypothetical protein